VTPSEVNRILDLLFLQSEYCDSQPGDRKKIKNSFYFHFQSNFIIWLSRVVFLFLGEFQIINPKKSASLGTARKLNSIFKSSFVVRSEAVSG
jgi:hypothetical protein